MVAPVDEALMASGPGGVSGNTAESVDSVPSDEIESQMKEVQQLIHEGPTIKKATAGLQQGHLSVDLSGSFEPADKRMRTDSSAKSLSGAEDAEALVGFLNSVRAATSDESAS